MDITIIEIWFKVLSWPNTKDVRPEGLAVSKYLLQQIVLNTERPQQRELVKRWQERKTYFIDEILKVDVADRDQRKWLKNESLVISNLRKGFEALTTTK